MQLRSQKLLPVMSISQSETGQILTIKFEDGQEKRQFLFFQALILLLSRTQKGLPLIQVPRGDFSVKPPLRNFIKMFVINIINIERYLLFLKY